MQSIEECRERLGGIFNIAVTPFQSDGVIDFKSLGDNIERVIALGYDGILIGGTYGEFPAMSPEERAQLFRQVMVIVGSRVPVMLCSASSDSRVSMELTKLAGDLGGLPMVTPPYVSEVTEDHILSFFSKMAPISKTGILIYNAPGIGITLSVPAIRRLAELKNVAGIKQGDLTPAIVDVLANTLPESCKLFCASDLVFPGAIVAGFHGVSSTNSCALPEVILATYRALKAGDTKQATRLHRLWYEFRALARRHGQPQTVKAAMRLRGFNGGLVRSPLIDLDDAAAGEVAECLKRLAKEPDTGVSPHRLH